MGRITIINIDGLNRLTNNINNFEKKLKTVVKNAIIKTSIENVVKNAQDIITIHNHVDTGRLRQSIHAEYNSKYVEKSYFSHKYTADISGENFIGKLNEKPNDLTVIIGTDVPYAGKIEFQYDAYMFPALEGSKDELKYNIQSSINRI